MPLLLVAMPFVTTERIKHHSSGTTLGHHRSSTTWCCRRARRDGARVSADWARCGWRRGVFVGQEGWRRRFFAEMTHMEAADEDGRMKERREGVW